ncbi:hypothetical protein ACO34A_19420 [Rhizobium sp. ACO-34A]|nr:hypothetical protein [Rhizobium sp. ACO-34A]ATN35979.1 hypothetical protein ACO34A_19420 [Rhizobium sp. ACO-34A]
MCSACESALGLAYEVLPETDMADAARAAHAAGEAWHFHVLAPVCKFNPNPGAFTFLLELTGRGRNICTVYEERPVGINKELLALLHGADALAKTGADTSVFTPSDENLLDRVSQAAAAGKAWHHHMMFPACGLNGSEGKWRILVEIEGDEPFSVDYDAEPIGVLNRVERIYFGLQ